MNLSATSTNQLKLVKTETKYFNSIHELGLAFKANDPDNFWPRPFPAVDESSDDFVKRLIMGETDPTPPFVPETMYWGLVGDTIVGRLAIRHHLNEYLEKFGGHIGYEVHPDYRRRGYATEMLRLALQTSLAQKIGKLLLTCSPDNLGSNRTILTNGGLLTQKIYVDFIGADRNHYWVDLTKP